ncbi:hypothetical protein [Sorangium sp. So ce124]|uniref:hypothetical protein n=1 Tax=Sorangium sp. So ce124 TaxID=3133280 RepID=UPI003F603F6F
MVSTKRDREQAIFLAGALGLFYVLAGIWPLVNLRTFEAITGPKSERWLVKTTGLLIAVIGTTLVISAQRSRIPPEVALLDGGAAAGLGTSASRSHFAGGPLWNERLCRSAGGAPER